VPMKQPSKHAAYRTRLRLAAFEVMGNRCAACGFEDQRALRIHHDRDAPGVKKLVSTAIHRAIVKRGRRKGVRLLCGSCALIAASG